MFKIRLIFLFSITFCFYGCDIGQTEINDLTDYAKSYGAYKVGSYWIFQNDSDLIQDSIFVTELFHKYHNYNHDNDIERAEEIYCRLKSSLFNSADLIIELNSHDGIYYRFFGLYFACRYNKNESSLKTYPGKPTIIYHDTLNVNGKIFNPCYQIIQPYDSTHDFNKLNAFLVSNIGLVKWTIHNNDSSIESWSLIRSKIIF